MGNGGWEDSQHVGIGAPGQKNTRGVDYEAMMYFVVAGYRLLLGASRFFILRVVVHRAENALQNTVGI